MCDCHDILASLHSVFIEGPPLHQTAITQRLNVQGKAMACANACLRRAHLLQNLGEHITQKQCVRAGSAHVVETWKPRRETGGLWQKARTAIPWTPFSIGCAGCSSLLRRLRWCRGLCVTGERTTRDPGWPHQPPSPEKDREACAVTLECNARAVRVEENVRTCGGVYVECS